MKGEQDIKSKKKIEDIKKILALIPDAKKEAEINDSNEEEETTPQEPRDQLKNRI